MKGARIGPIALSLGILSCAGALAVGLLGYSSSLRHTEERLRLFYLDRAHLLAEFAASLPEASDSEILVRMKNLWEAESHRPNDEYICIVDADAVLVLHTAAPDTVGNYAGDNRLLNGEAERRWLRQLPGCITDYVGGYLSSAGEEQIAAFVAVPDREWVVGVHRSQDALRNEVFSAMLDSSAGLFVVCGVLMPLSLLLIYRTARLASLERKKAAEALAVSNERFQTVMDSFDALVYVADMDTYEILYINRFGRQIWGDITGATCWERLQSNQTGPCSFCTNHLLVDDDGRPAGVHVWEFQNTVDQRWYECRDQAIQWTDGRLVRMEVATDITARKEAERVLQEREEELRQVLTDLPIGVVIVDYETHRIVEVNSLAASIIGAPREQIIGNVCHRFICPNQEGDCPITDRGQAVHSGERVLLTASGEERPIIKSVVPITMGGRKYLLEGFLDITERKEAEEIILSQNRFLNNVLESLTHPFYVIDTSNYRIRMANSAATANGPPGAVTCHKLTHRSDVPCHSEEHPCPIDEVMREQTPVTLEHVHYTREGRPRHVEVHAYPVFGEDGAVTEIIEYSLDITQRKAFERRQEVNIDLANRLLSLVNAECPRHIEVDAETLLFIEPLSTPCHSAGGDHFLARTICSTANGDGSKTVLSLKDQSGHEVNCVLRSIITDLMHNALLQRAPEEPIEKCLSRLNDEVCRSGLFQDDDFITAANVEIDHDTLMMRYVSCGHPPPLVIRKGGVHLLSSEDSAGKNLPVGAMRGVRYSAGVHQLQVGDQLILYTDGLLDMPVPNHGRRITPEELVTLAEDVLSRHPNVCVSDLSRGILEQVARTSDEEVVPPDRNTSQDDVTIVGIEVEGQRDFSEAQLIPRDREHLSSAVSDLSRTIANEWQPLGLGESDVRVPTILEESVFNAWLHGHKRDPDRPITVRWRHRNDFHIEVIDQGGGFDVKQVADPTAFQNRLNESGRGVFMMRLSADSVRWRDGGRRLVASVKRNGTSSEREQTKQIRKLMRLWEAARKPKENDHGA